MDSLFIVITGMVMFTVGLAMLLVTKRLYWGPLILVGIITVLYGVITGNLATNKEVCRRLSEGGQVTILDGDCWVEIKPGLYQSTSSKRPEFKTVQELRK